MLVRLAISLAAAWLTWIVLLSVLGRLPVPPTLGGPIAALTMSLPLAVFLGVSIWLRRTA